MRRHGGLNCGGSHQLIRLLGEVLPRTDWLGRTQRWHPAPLRRLEALSEQRQSKLQRVKAAQKERDGLAGDKEVAEMYLAKERECLGQQSMLAQLLVSMAKVRQA